MRKLLETAFNRRAVLSGAAAAALAMPSIVRAQDRKPAKVSIGRQPYAAGNSPLTQRMINEKLLEKAAAELGYDLTVDWRDYPSALPMVEAFVSGDLDIGMWGNTPIVRLLSQAQPINILTVGEGHMRMVLATRKGSAIKNIGDLKGKTVGALVGGDPYNALSQMLLQELGDADPRAFGINIVNTPTQAVAASLPEGMDASVVIYPAFLKANAETGLTGIMNSFGYTEAGYSGPAGEGEGHMLPGVKKSKFYPDGYYLHRSFWICSDRIVGDDAALGQAFLTAAQRALADLQKIDPREISQSVVKYWGLDPALGAKVIGDEVLFQRGWIWPTEGDAAAISQISQFMVAGKMIPEALSWDQVKAAFGKAAPLLQKAYEGTGKVPDESGFTDKNAKDLRGLPAWQLDQWKVPS
ncbi:MULTISPECIES: PhnD/SsuA/transferrin family substrate-binding protein [unclassified Mesorhizobium]|uniref:ABC transporter substrate-binding protein n=1 Tax=unclassified Mesorhizobium TaxID=325217 RepID=UPI00112CACCF|nr:MULTISPECIES: PhnD/SsuA/transferrin family substrate-binding protein [unclassified Mesorhizobium]TPJ41351.1 ABC transporter substrate-binding protein [Mesorhizobium sp. B2-6-6]MBZ9982053.1 PhnD/SsuA/transferrin family substrate-binding protein [Mesorhizobium sp. BR-1-1-8]MCA0002370.1 PhnD/SsuA/transferrin family substrate-binding protein [Mesorhizobium sp. B264B2A]MCA0008280.1 PhnD/SsuA/transferrin family substrate-binding protein [Mesorhizobium sp. B264B1B]MCA0021656.1 PhnD/SsuA/transferri